MQAKVEEYDDILVTLLGETAAAYVELRTAQERLRLARLNVEAEKGGMKIAKLRYDSGESDKLDYYQAKTNVANTEALIPGFEELERKAEIRLCVLMGMPPRDLTPELGEGPIPSAPPTVALGIPADLLRRRPDVRKAEREVAAQRRRSAFRRPTCCRKSPLRARSATTPAASATCSVRAASRASSRRGSRGTC